MQYVSRGRKVMVVDNERAVLEMLQIRLDVAGYHSLAARTGGEAVEMIRAARPEVLVLSADLPDMDGVGVLEALSSDGRPPLFCTLLTGRNPTPEQIRRAGQLGARACLAKPFSGADVLDRVGRILERRAATSQKVHYV